MSIKPLKTHYSMENRASIYDEEAMTALELAGRTANKVNEVIESQNKLATDTQKTLDTIPDVVSKDVQDHIDNGSFDEAISNYAGDLSTKVDNLINHTTPGSTTFDNEIIDARLRDGQPWADGSLGATLRFMCREAFTPKTPPMVNGSYNADYCNEMGVYWAGSGSPWENIPTSGGYLIVLTDARYRGDTDGGGSGEYVTKTGVLTQLYIPVSYDGIYFRCKKSADSTEFWEWEKCVTSGEIDTLVNDNLNPVKYELNANTMKYKLLSYETYGDPIDIDNIDDNGFYFISSGMNYNNLPEGEVAGLLISYKGPNIYSVYQIYMSYFGGMYYRNGLAAGGFSAWEKCSTGSGSGGSATPSSRYTVKKTSDTSIDIYEHQTKGDVVYHYGYDTNGCCRIMGVDLKLANGTTKTVCGSGHDIEGVVKEDDTFKGGVHGGETTDENGFAIRLDGKMYTFDTITDDINCDYVEIYSYNIIMLNYDEQVKRYKKIIFDAQGYHVENKFIGTGANGIETWYGMCSVMKEVCDTYSDNKDYFTPVTVTDPDPAPMFINNNLNGGYKATFSGDYAVINTSADIIEPYTQRGPQADNVDFIKLYNYGDRLKLYHYMGLNFDDKITRSNIQIIVGG